MSTVNLVTKDVLIANDKNTITLLRKGILKRDCLVGAVDTITIPNVPENLAKRINSDVAVTIDDIKVKVDDAKTIAEIYANTVMVAPVETKVEEVVAEVAAPVVEEPVVEEAPVEEVQFTENTVQFDEEQEVAVEETEATEEVAEDEETLEVEEEEEVVEETVNTNNGQQNNQFNYKKKRRR